MLNAIVTIYMWVFVSLYMVAIWPIVFVTFLVTAPFDPKRRAVHWLSCLWASTYIVVNPLWRVRVEGREKIDRSGTYIFVVNHQSIIDIILMYMLWRHFKWVAKSALYKVPFIGWNMWVNGYVGLDRKDPKSHLTMLRKSTEHLEKGSSMLLFPEGTRTQDGEIKRFKDGAFLLSRRTGVPVVPIVIDGAYQAIPKKGFFLQETGNMVMKVLDPIDPKDFDNTKSMAQHVRDVMVGTLAAYRGDTAATS